MFKSTFHKQAILSRIMSGQFRFMLNGIEYISVANTLEEKEEADYRAYIAYEESELPTEEETIEMSIIQRIWDAKLESNLKELEDILKEKKKDVYKLLLAGNEAAVKQAKTDIEMVYKGIGNLSSKKYKFAHLSRDNLATTLRRRILVLYSIRLNGNRLYLNPWLMPDDVSDKIASAMIENLASDEQIKELARTDPWLSIWMCGNPFSPLNMTDEQLKLVSWSKYYDTIRQHQECPPDIIFKDSDGLEGWAIIQNEKNERNKNVQNVDKGNEKLKKATERFETTKQIIRLEDGKNTYIYDDNLRGKIHNYNTDEAKAVKREREEYISKVGVVPAHCMPDTRREIQMEINRNYHAKN